ncbi:putative myosin-binding protein [Helianthus annuus]|nr:putative myosin-binding protein [Helianthus annuus]
MALSERSLQKFVIEEMGGFTHFLLWAILEWILIASLYIDGFIAFMTSMFANIFELEPPCVLCTRVDHALVRNDPKTYYNESICECHQKDISSLAFCHVHRKLSDIQNMCEGCLLSFATEKEKSFVGSQQKDDDGFNDDGESSLDVKRCSCCGEPLNTRASTKDYSRSFSNVRASIIATSSPRVISSPKVITCFTPTWKTDESRYTELKFVSDSEELDMLPDSEENEEPCRTPDLLKNNNFFGIALTDSMAVSPRFTGRAPKKASLEKSKLSETNDETSGDGDSTLKQLKKQARLDRKALQSLSMELEEERSASAVAANNAMAMITRLQAEKASVQMEALQYQRMMEEQAQYDQEAIQILQDMLAKRDEQVRVMESELESYREKYGDVRKVGMDECEAEADEYYHEWRSQTSSFFGEKSPEPVTPFEHDYEEPVSLFGNEPPSSSPMDFKESRAHEEDDDESHSGRSVENEGDTYEEPLLDFENEKHQLYSMLRDLENHMESSSLEDEDENTAQESRVALKREVSQIKERLRVLEADSGFLKHTAMTLQKGEKGAELLTEIAQHLRKLCHSEDISTKTT